MKISWKISITSNSQNVDNLKYTTDFEKTWTKFFRNFHYIYHPGNKNRNKIKKIKISTFQVFLNDWLHNHDIFQHQELTCYGEMWSTKFPFWCNKPCVNCIGPVVFEIATFKGVNLILLWKTAHVSTWQFLRNIFFQKTNYMMKFLRWLQMGQHIRAKYRT
jgi:hypothetical protein